MEDCRIYKKEYRIGYVIHREKKSFSDIIAILTNFNFKEELCVS